MATVNPIWTPVGARHARIYELSTSTGVISAGTASTTAYTGFWVSGVRGLELTSPEPQVIYHAGDDSIFQVDSLPATEAITGTLTTGKINLTINEELTGDKVVTAGERKYAAFGTSNQGSELQVCMLVYQQALDTQPGSSTEGQRRWSWMLLPKALIIPQQASFGGTEFVQTYTVRPQFVSSYPWGLALASATEGSTRVQGFRGLAEYKPMINAWTGNNTITTFNLSTTYAAAATAKVKLYVYDASGASGADGTSGATITVSTVQPTTTPDTSDVVVAFYEHNVAETA